MKNQKKKKNNPKKYIKWLFYNLFWVIIKAYQGEQVQEAVGAKKKERKKKVFKRKKKPVEKSASEKAIELLMKQNAEMLKKSMAGVLA